MFTEVELPVNQIMHGHENDTLNSAKFELQRYISHTTSSYKMNIPQYVLLIPTELAESFFNENKVLNNKTSFLARYNSQTNSYKFDNMAGIINYFARNRATSASNTNWGKALVIPVEVRTSKDEQNNEVVNRISHYMGLSSVMLLGGNQSMGNIKISVVYSKFNGR